MGARKKVVILGGGVAGMSAAHELVARGFEVEVFERKPIAGGKARSIATTDASRGRSPFQTNRLSCPASRPTGRPLPGEHGFRFFPGFYRHIVDTMGHIPYQGGVVTDNLVNTTEISVAPFDRPSFALPAQFPQTSEDLHNSLMVMLVAISGQAGLTVDDALFFTAKVWQFLASCEERRLTEYERINWWDFIEAAVRSEGYQKYFGNGITRSLVAAKARRASTKTIGDIFVQIVFNILLPGVAADRVLNGPTNDVWINPWLEYLRRQGVKYHLNSDVREIRCERGVIRSATVAVAGSPREVTGDYFIGALPVERMAELVSPSLVEADASLVNLQALVEYVEWMNGIQYYLTEDIRMTHGHVICVDTPWALTLVSQPQFWNAFDLTKYGDGTVKGLLSVDLSDWDVKGMNGKEARHCSRDEIARETWAQLKRSLNAGGEILRDEQLHSWFLDPDIEDLDVGADPSMTRFDTNAEPLLVNYVDTWRLRPEAVTRISNLFLASDYVRTYTDLATMEGANEAARRAVNGILRAARSDAEPCRIWNLHEPEALAPLRAYDRVRYRQGLPWNSTATSYAKAALTLSSLAARLSGLDGLTSAASGDESDSADQVAAEARASSDDGLRRLRIRSGV